MIIDQGGRARASTRYLAPPPGLDEVVVEGWVQRYPVGVAAEGRAWRIVPDLQPHLLVHGSRDGRPGSVRIVGARSVHRDRPAGGRGWTVGVTLQPGVLARLAGVDAGELLDRSVPVGEALGGPGRRLDARVGEAAGPEAVARALLGFLARVAEARSLRPDWRVRAFLEASARAARPRVSGIAGALGVSTRSLREAWSREVGLPPRTALSVDRLHRAVRRRLRDPGASWSEVARGVGYYDQPHLIRHFQALVGETPRAFLARGRAG